MGFRHFSLSTGIVLAMAAIATPVMAAGAQARQFNIPANSLRQALKDFSRATGSQLIYSGGDVAGHKSPAIVGVLSDDLALDRLLQGSNLVAARSPRGVIMIRLGSQSVAPAPRTQAFTKVAVQTVMDQPAPSAPAVMDNFNDAVEEIIVTAQGREQRLQDVPLSAAVISGAALEKNNVRDLQDLGNRVASVRITSAPASDQLNIRGVGSGLNSNFEQSVGTFVDGVYRGRSRATRAALFDVSRVEILKGPQTTFFGNNAIAGALNITTREPGDSLAVNGNALYGSDGEYAVELGLTGPVNDNLSVRIAGKAYGMDGYVKNDLTGGKGPRQRDWIGRASAKWTPSDSFTSFLRVDRGRNRDDDALPLQIVNCAPGTPAAQGLCGRYLAQSGTAVDDRLDYHAAGAPSYFNYDFVEVAWRNELRLDNATVKSLTSYLDHKVEATFNLSPYPVLGLTGTNGLIATHTPETYRSFSQELRVESDADQVISYTLGGYYARGRLKNDGVLGYFFAPFGAALTGVGYSATSPLASSTLFRQKEETWSGFGALSWRATESLRINGALRYSIVSKDASRSVLTGLVPLGTVFPTRDMIIPGTSTQQATANLVLAQDARAYADGTRTDRKLMPSINMQYNVNRQVMAYGSFTRGFKAGGFSSASSINQFGPEVVDAFEVGIKTKLFDNRVTFNASLFWNIFDDLQEASNFLLPNGTSLQLVQNAAKARVRGVETSVSVRLTPALSLNADLAYLDSQYVSFPNAPCAPSQSRVIPNCRQNLAGVTRPYAAKFSGNFGLNLTLPAGNGVFSFDPSVYFTSRYSQQVYNDPLFDQPGYAKIDARIAYGATDRRWEVAVIGKNLTNKTTASFRTGAQNFGTVAALVERDRSIAAQVSFRY